MEIVFNNVTVKNSLKELNLVIKANEITVLSGDVTKEVVSKLLMGLKNVSSGEINLLNKVINKGTNNYSYIQSKTGYVFLNPKDFLSNKTVKQEIAFGLKYYGFNNINNRVLYYLNLVGLDSVYLEKRSLEIDLNGQKKVMLASVLAIEPKILILNYIDHGLSLKEQKDLKKVLKGLNKLQEITIILISNNTEFFFDIADRLIIFNKQKIVVDVLKEDFYNKKISKHLDLLPITKFINTAKKQKIDLIKTGDIKELMKDIYRKVNEKR